ncbi:MAG TPA: ferrous iron transporter B, partial [Anaeromyxobacteraceae bacterium]|nr:ferrous iron transporter B [Anaeromyxobacteraceae bacterium]
MNAPAFRVVVAPSPDRPLVVAVAGNPNAGKSTLINAIAGTRLHVGNWPGVTVEKKEAAFEHAGRPIRLVDLPGTYSLSPYSQEERVARDFLADERPDVVVNVVDATNLERNLYLTVQLLELGIPVVVALNVFDEAEAKGYRIDVPAMSERLGCPVVPTAATKKRGLTELLDAAIAATAPGALGAAERIRHRPEVEAAIAALAGGREDEELEALVADARYGLAAGLTREVLRKPKLRKTELTERIDKIVLNRFLGIPIFLGAMWLVFKLTFDLSAPFGDWIDAMANGPFKRWAAALLGGIGAPDWTVSL